MADSAPRIKCTCSVECQEMISSIQLNGMPRKYAVGHGRGGVNHSNWKGGRVKMKGYWYIWVPDHPQSSKKGYVAEHRLYYEEYYNCCLLPYIELHHRDGNIINNFDINNLQPVTKSEHIRITHKKDMSDRVCLLCGSNETYMNKLGCKCWSRDPITQQEWLCKKCLNFRMRNNGLRKSAPT